MKSFESQITAEGFSFEEARTQEETFLRKFVKNPKTRALATVFLLATAACGNIESDNKKHEQSAGGEKKQTRIETREFKGYGIHTKQRVEIDQNGNIVRALPPETPYGGK